MDLSFARHQPFARAFGLPGALTGGVHVASLPSGPRSGLPSALPVELAVLLVGVVSRQATSPTARMQALLSRQLPCAGRLAPDGGAFDAAMATALRRWQQE